MQTQRKIVAVTGMGIVSSAGSGCQSFSETLKKGKSYFSIKHYPQISFPVIGAYISDFDFIKQLAFFHLEKTHQTQIIKIARSLPVNLHYAIIAALEAWEQAKLFNTTIELSRVGLVVAAQNSTTQYQYELYPTFTQDPEYLTPTYALNYLDTNYIGTISEILKIKGEGFTVGGASASGNVALLRGRDLIINGNQDICLVIGSSAELSPMDIQGFRNIGAMGGQHFQDKPEQACRPFDQEHEGFIFGQAAAAIVLESITSAFARKVPILGYFHGGALVLDGNHLSNPTAAGEGLAMQKALQVAQISPDNINYINTHGTSSPIGDETEIAAIEMLFPESVMLNSTKSLVGHCLWSAGVVEAIATVMQINEHFLHPNLNLIHPISQESSFVSGKSQSFEIHYALSNSFGFGGINSSLIFSKLK